MLPYPNPDAGILRHGVEEHLTIAIKDFEPIRACHDNDGLTANPLFYLPSITETCVWAYRRKS